MMSKDSLTNFPQRLRPLISASWNLSSKEVKEFLRTNQRGSQADRDRLTLLDWTLEYRRIKNKTTNLIESFNLQEYPWLEHLYNNTARILDVRKCAQFGVTEYLINMTLWLVDEFAATVFYALPPGKGVTSDFVYTRLDKGIIQTPRISEMKRDVDNVGLKVFGGGAIYIRGTFVPQGQPEKAPQLSAVPADVVLIDEYDRIPPSAIPLLKERLGDSRLAVERNVGTPTYPDVGIDQRYQNSTHTAIGSTSSSRHVLPSTSYGSAARARSRLSSSRSGTPAWGKRTN